MPYTAAHIASRKHRVSNKRNDKLTDLKESLEFAIKNKNDIYEELCKRSQELLATKADYEKLQKEIIDLKAEIEKWRKYTVKSSCISPYRMDDEIHMRDRDDEAKQKRNIGRLTHKDDPSKCYCGYGGYMGEPNECDLCF
jgi:hypothetical protein